MFKRLQIIDGIKLSFIIKLGFLRIYLWTVFEVTSITGQTVRYQSYFISMFYANFVKNFSIYGAAEY